MRLNTRILQKHRIKPPLQDCERLNNLLKGLTNGLPRTLAISPFKFPFQNQQTKKGVETKPLQNQAPSRMPYQMAQKCAGTIAKYEIRYGNEGRSFLQHLTPRITRSTSARHYASQPTATLRELNPRLGMDLIKPSGLFPLPCVPATRKMARCSWISQRGFFTSSMFLVAIFGQVSKKAQVGPLFKQSSMPWNLGYKLHGSSWSWTSMTG